MRLSRCLVSWRCFSSSSPSSSSPLSAPAFSSSAVCESTVSSATPPSSSMSVFVTRSTVTKQIWAQRLRDFQRIEHKFELTLSGAASATETQKESLSAALGAPQSKPLSASRLRVTVPFSSDTVLREEYRNPFGFLRMGLLLEDFDAFCASCAFLHVDDKSPDTPLPTVVTASVDKLVLSRPLMADQDLTLAGSVVSVGRSSMIVRLEAFQRDERVLLTYFTMVARQGNKALEVPRLEPESETERQLIAQGDLVHVERLKARSESTRLIMPTTNELQLLHQFFLSEEAKHDDAFMEESHQRSLIFCSHQQRNINNKIFGGYLMRAAYELAFSTCYMYAGRTPLFYALGDITFANAVPIGALLDLRSAVVFTEQNCIVVHVTARVHNPEQGTVIKTNDFTFAFRVLPREGEDPLGSGWVQKVRPRTYSEGMSFIEGRRNLFRFSQNLN